MPTALLNLINKKENLLARNDHICDFLEELSEVLEEEEEEEEDRPYRLFFCWCIR